MRARPTPSAPRAAARRAPGAAVPQQPSVLDRRGFTLFTVGDHDRATGPTAVVADGLQLDGEREGRAATAEDTGQVDLAEQAVRIVEGLVSARLAVLGVFGLGALSQQPGSMPGHTVTARSVVAVMASSCPRIGLRT